MQISLKLIHAKSTVCTKFQLLVTFSSLFTASSVLQAFPRLLLYSPASSLLLLCSYPALPQLQLLSCTFLAPRELLPSSCSLSALLYSSQLCSYPATALLMLLPCSCFSPGLLMPFSCPAPGPAHPNLAAFIIISTLQVFSARREPPFMV